jgi:transporter family protein
MNSWITPALAALFVWGLWGFLPKITVRYVDPRSAIIFQILGAVMTGLIVLFLGRFHLRLEPVGIGLGILTGVLGSSGALFFLYAVERGPVALVATVSSLYPVISVILALFFLHETLTLRQLLGIAFAITGILLIAK